MPMKAVQNVKSVAGLQLQEVVSSGTYADSLDCPTLQIWPAVLDNQMTPS